jgi:hypothetical protein
MGPQVHTMQPRARKMLEGELPPVPISCLYSISDAGRVMFHSRRVTRRHTRPYWQRGGILTPRLGNDYGHWCVTLYDIDGRPSKRYVHHLVADAFIERVEGKPLVLHGPGGKDDNRAHNLRWGTHSENELDKYR